MSYANVNVNLSEINHFKWFCVMDNTEALVKPVRVRLLLRDTFNKCIFILEYENIWNS